MIKTENLEIGIILTPDTKSNSGVKITTKDYFELSFEVKITF